MQETVRKKRAAPAMAVGALLLGAVLLPACTTIRESSTDSAREMPTGSALARYHCEMAEKAWRGGEDGMAMRHLTDAAHADPAMLEPRLGLIDFHIARGFHDQAFKLISGIPEALKDRVEVRERLVYVLELSGDREGAAAEVERYDGDDANRGLLFKTMAEARLFMNDFGGAMQFYEKVLELDGNDEQALKALAQIYELNGRDAARGYVLLRLITVCPSEPEHPLAAAETMHRAGLDAEAVAELEALRRDGSGIVRSDVCCALALLHYKNGRWLNALACYEEARGRGGSLLDRADRMRLGEVLLRLGENRRAATELQALLDEEPGDTVVRAALVLAYWRSGLEERARMVMENRPAGTEKGIVDAVERRIRREAAGD